MMRFIATALTVLIYASAASGQQTDLPLDDEALAKRAGEAAESLPHSVASYMARKPEQYSQQLAQFLFSADPDGRVTAETLKQKEEIDHAKRRAASLNKLLIYDLNGDGAVTKAESEIALRTAAAKEKAQAATFRAEADRDGDGDVSFAEAVAVVDARLATGRRRSTFPFDVMILDFNADGVLDLDEANLSLKAITDWMEQNGVPEKQRKQGRFSDRGPKLAAPCEIPSISDEDIVVVVSGYEGGALSTVAVAGPNLVAEVTRLRIEKGSKPIYVLVGAYRPMLWIFEGATERVRHVVVQNPRLPSRSDEYSNLKGAGVAGVARDVVTFASSNTCFIPEHKGTETRLKISKARISQRIGAGVDVLAMGYTLGRVALPSGNFEGGKKPKRGITINGQEFKVTPHGRLEPVEPPLIPELRGLSTPPEQQILSNLKRFHPFGVIAVDPSHVISPTPVKSYDVLPQQAGLLQLLKEGALDITSDNYYVIKKPIPRFPAGLSGAHSVKFVLEKGVPMPSGGAGHSQVIDIETGECLKGHQCK